MNHKRTLKSWITIQQLYEVTPTVQFIRSIMAITPPTILQS